MLKERAIYNVQLAVEKEVGPYTVDNLWQWSRGNGHVKNLDVSYVRDRTILQMSTLSKPRSQGKENPSSHLCEDGLDTEHGKSAAQVPNTKT